MDFLEELMHAGHPYSKDPALYKKQKEEERRYNHEYYMKHRHLDKKQKTGPSVLDILKSKDTDEITKFSRNMGSLNRLQKALLERMKTEAPSIYNDDSLTYDDMKCAVYLTKVYGSRNKAAMALNTAFTLRGMGNDLVTAALMSTAKVTADTIDKKINGIY